MILNTKMFSNISIILIVFTYSLKATFQDKMSCTTETICPISDLLDLKELPMEYEKILKNAINCEKDFYMVLEAVDFITSIPYHDWLIMFAKWCCDKNGKGNKLLEAESRNNRLKKISKQMGEFQKYLFVIIEDSYDPRNIIKRNLFDIKFNEDRIRLTEAQYTLYKEFKILINFIEEKFKSDKRELLLKALEKKVSIIGQNSKLRILDLIAIKCFEMADSELVSGNNKKN